MRVSGNETVFLLTLIALCITSRANPPLSNELSLYLHWGTDGNLQAFPTEDCLLTLCICAIAHLQVGWKPVFCDACKAAVPEV